MTRFLFRRVSVLSVGIPLVLRGRSSPLVPTVRDVLNEMLVIIIDR